VVHGVLEHPLQILDASLNGILVLVVGFRLAVTDGIETEEIMNPLTEFRFGIVRHDTNRCTISTDKVLKGMVHLAFRSKRGAMEKLRVKATKDLNHGTATMAWNTIVMGRNVIEEGISREPLRDTTDIGSREPGLEVLPERMVDGSTVILGGRIKGGFDTVSRNPGKVGSEEVQIRETRAQLSWVLREDSSSHDRNGSDNRGNRQKQLVHTGGVVEPLVGRNILPKVIDPRVLGLFASNGGIR
jgi:hypothetical protein